MNRINLEVLKQFFEAKEIDGILFQDLFTQLLHQMEQSLGIYPVDKEVSVSLTDNWSNTPIDTNNIYTCFVARKYVKEHLHLTFYYSVNHSIPIPELPSVLYHHLFPYIILRELYTCFIPMKVKNYESLQYALFLIICYNSQKYRFPFLEEWQRYIGAFCPKSATDALIGEDLRDQQLKYLQLYGEMVITDFFNFIQKNANILDSHENYSEVLFQGPEKYTWLQFLNNPSIVETYRCIREIFLDSKTYQYLSDFESQFRERKRNLGDLYSTQDQRQFERNLEVLRKTEVNPGYRMSWDAIGLIVCGIELKFHPLIPIYELEILFREFDFIYIRRISFTALGCEMYLGFFLPQEYETDLNQFFSFLYKKGYIIEYKLFKSEDATEQLNLNAVQSVTTFNNLINPLLPEYVDQYNFIEYRKVYRGVVPIPFSFIELLLISQQYGGLASHSLGFSTPKERLDKLNQTLSREVQNKLRQYEDLRVNFELVRTKPNLISYFKKIITEHRKSGFLYLRKLFSDLNSAIKSIDQNIFHSYLKSGSKITTSGLIEKLNMFRVSSQLQDNLVFTDKRINTILQKQILNLVNGGLDEGLSSLEEFQSYITLCKSLFDACFKLFFFDLKSILRILESDTLFEQIFKTDKVKIDQYYTPLKKFTFTDNYIYSKLNQYLTMEPPLITPTVAGFPLPFRLQYDIIVKYSEKNANQWKQFSKHFFCSFLSKSLDLTSHEKCLYISVYLPQLTPKEQLNFISIIHHLYQEDLLSIKFYQGYRFLGNVFAYRDYYSYQKDLDTGAESGSFKYTPQFFSNLKLFVQETLGKGYVLFRPNHKSDITIFLSSNTDILALQQTIYDRLQKEETALSSYNTRNEANFFDKREYKGTDQFLLTHRKALLEQLVSFFHATYTIEKIQDARTEDFFKLYLKSIKFLPKLGHFGLGQYYLYIYPFNLSNIPLTDSSKEGIDFKLLLGNTFQKIWHTATFDNSFPILIQYLYPFDNWYSGYLNWLVNSKRAIREYCMIMIKSVYYNFHLERNLEFSRAGVFWEYLQIDRRFQDYVQKILYDETYSPQFPRVYECNMEEIPEKQILGQDTPEFKALTQIYGWDSIEFISENPRKSYPFLKKSIIEIIFQLLNKNLIFPFPELKNTQLDYEYMILVPNLTSLQFENLFKIFLFFNRCIIYKIKGELYINGLNDIIKFETGMLVKLYLPNIRLPIATPYNLSDVLLTLIKTFKLLKVEHFIILDNLVEGTEFLKNIFKSENDQYLTMKGDLTGKESGIEFMNAYNPLTNIIWSHSMRKWIVEKQFGEEFVPKYSELFKNTTEKQQN